LQERLEIVRRKLLTGETRKAVRLMIAEEWGIKPTQAYWYLKQAEAEIAETANREKSAWLSEHIAIRRDIRRRASNAADLRVELAAAESEAKLLGLDPATRHELSAPGAGPIAITEIVIQHHIPVPADPDEAHPAPGRDGGRGAGDLVPEEPDAGLDVHG
jgi:hypothetical protein